jgi:hypothetical protein
VVDDLGGGLVRQLRWRAWALRVVVGLAVAVGAFGVLYRLGDDNLWAALYAVYRSNVLIYLPLALGVFLIPLLIARRMRGGRAPGAMLRSGLCPHCGYDLRGSPADEEDGATVCPECGCAWRLDSTGVEAQA